MNTTYQRKSQGFTIIEVVLVLAIAGLILLMVFIALPALQRGQRDTQRRNDVGRMMSQVNSYQTNSRGAVPNGETLEDPFLTSYMKWTSEEDSEFADPKTGVGYAVTYGTGTPTEAGQISFSAGAICGDGGSIVTDGAGERNVAAAVFLEGSGIYCADNR